MQLYKAHLNTKTIIPLMLRTIYPRMMVGTETKGQCICIGRSDADRIFLKQKEAEEYFAGLKDLVPDDTIESVTDNNSEVTDYEDNGTDSAITEE